MTLSQRNLAIYGLLGLILVVAQWANSAIASGEVDWFAAYPAAQYKGLALAILGYVIPVLTLGAAAYRTRIGSEGVAAQVNDLREQGVHRDEMVVLPKDDAVPVVAGALTDAQIDQLVAALHGPVVNALEVRMQTTPADSLVSKPPTWLDTSAPAEGRG